jgi:hypothetical protein
LFLALDLDRQIRLATLSLHAAIVSVSSKSLAPLLKSIIGTWIAAQFDTSADVAQLAKDSFKVHSFPNDL